MELKTKVKVTKIKKKTSAKFFKNLKVGDEFELVYDLNGSYGYSPKIDIRKDGELVYNNALQISRNLSNFELEILI